MPVAGLTVGWPVQKRFTSMRLPQSVVVHRERYDDANLAQDLAAYDDVDTNTSTVVCMDGMDGMAGSPGTDGIVGIETGPPPPDSVALPQIRRPCWPVISNTRSLVNSPGLS